MSRNISIFGIGGHAKVVIESANLNGFIVDSLFDDDVRKLKTYFNEIEIRGPIDNSFKGYSVVAIGDNKIRKIISDRVSRGRWVTIIHPSAIISKDVLIGEGAVIMAGAIIQPGTKIGKHCIINTGTCLDHDCVIKDFVHISPSVTLCGNVVVGEGTHVGAAATIIPNIKIGKWCVIGAGAVITKDVPDHSLVVGVPGKKIKSLENEQI